MIENKSSNQPATIAGRRNSVTQDYPSSFYQTDFDKLREAKEFHNIFDFPPIEEMPSNTPAENDQKYAALPPDIKSLADNVDAQLALVDHACSKVDIHDPFAMFLHDVKAYPLLKYEEEIELGSIIKRSNNARDILKNPSRSSFFNNDEPSLVREYQLGFAAKKKLVAHNLLLVVSIALRKGYGDINDRIQNGNLGLIHAADIFDYQRAKFSTHASWWIYQRINRESMNNQSAVRIPIHRLELHGQFYREEENLFQKLGRYPTSGELAEALNISLKKVEELRHTYLDTTSLNRRLGRKKDIEFEDVLLDDRNIDDEIFENGIYSVEDPKLYFTLNVIHAKSGDEYYDLISEKERQILKLTSGIQDGETYSNKAISKILSMTSGNISRERVRQIKNAAMNKILARYEVYRTDNLIETPHDEYMKTRIAREIPEKTSNQDIDILNFLSLDVSNKEIANGLNIDLQNMKDSLRRIYKKLGAKDRHSAVVKAEQMKLINIEIDPDIIISLRKLTPTELEVLDLITAHTYGFEVVSNRKASNIKLRLTSIYKKLGVGRTQAILAYSHSSYGSQYSTPSNW